MYLLNDSVVTGRGMKELCRWPVVLLGAVFGWLMLYCGWLLCDSRRVVSVLSWVVCGVGVVGRR